MSTSKKQNLLENLTRRDARKPPMEVTYENKGAVLEEAFGLGEQNTKNANMQNSKNTEQQTSADAKEQSGKAANQQIVIPAVTSQETLSPEEQIGVAGRELAGGAPVTSEQQTFIAAEEQNSSSANTQMSTPANEQTFAEAEKQNSKSTEEQNSRYAKMRRITFHIPEETFKQLKLISLEEDLTMLEIGAQMAEEYVKRKRKQ